MIFKKRDDSCHTVQDVVEKNVGMKSSEFLNSNHAYFIYHLQEAFETIRSYVAKNGMDAKINIIGDYDSDGIHATAILSLMFQELGCRNLFIRLPKRFSEGYGLSENIVDEITEGLVITVDNGIAAINAIQKAKNKNLPVVILDHHLAVTADEKQALPNADVIVDPAVEEHSDFHHYCGAHLALELSKLMLNRTVPHFVIMASIATVTDIMPLTEANRALVQDGLRLINQPTVYEPYAILKEKLGLRDVTVYDYGFRIGPIFNAAERMFDGGAETALHYLTDDMPTVKRAALADTLIHINDQRKKDVEQGLLQTEQVYDQQLPIVLYIPNLNEGIIGIIASDMSEKYNAPCILLTNAKDPGIIKGSGRSIPNIHLKHTLDQVSQYLIKYGGHAEAAGLAMKRDDFNQFKQAWTQSVNELNVQMGPKETLYYDIDINRDLQNDIGHIKEQIYALDQYAPFGVGNPKPTFYLKANINPANLHVMQGSHFKVNGRSMNLLAFNKWADYVAMGSPTLMECIGTIKESVYNNIVSYDFVINHMQPIKE